MRKRKNGRKRRKVILRPSTPKQVAHAYRISVSTLNRRLKKYRAMLGPKKGQFYDTNQLELITEILGWFRVELRED